MTPFTLRLPPALHTACQHYADVADESLQNWVQKVLAQHVGTEALAVAAYAALSGRTPVRWPELPEELE